MLFCGLPLPESVETVRLSVVHVVPLVPDPNASGAAVLIRPTSSRRRSMKGMSGAFPGRVRAPTGRRRTIWPSGQAGLGSGLRASKGFATLLLTLVDASSVVWVLPHPGTVHRNAFDVLGPRWKDESATHFMMAASADFGGLDNTDSMALAVRARTAGVSFPLALGDLGYTTNEAAWCSQMKRLMPELVIVPGIHDVGGSGGGNISRYVKNCPYPLSSAVMPGPGTPGYGFEYYFDYPTEKPLARFIMISPGL